jgi:YD repeat-containing protein
MFGAIDFCPDTEAMAQASNVKSPRERIMMVTGQIDSRARHEMPAVHAHVMALAVRGVVAGLAMSSCTSVLAIPGWEGESFKPLAYHNDYVPLGPTPQSVCAAFAAVWHWNTNGYSARVTEPTSQGWKCQRYYNGVIDPGNYTFVRGVFQTAAAAPLQPGSHWSHPTADLANDLFHCETGKRFDRAIQWCVPGTASSGMYSPNWDRSCPSPNPVYPASGNKVEVEMDYSSGGLASFRRSYSYRSNSTTTVVPVGPAWRLRLGTTLELVGLLPTQVKAWSTEGQVTSFEKNQAGDWRATAGSRDRLVELSTGGARTGWLFYDLAQNVLNTYSADGTLQSIWRIDGASITFTYSDGTTPSPVAPWIGTLIRATTSFGRSLEFISSLEGVTQVVTPGAQVDGAVGTSLSPIRYAYQEAGSLGPGVKSAGQLSSVTYPDGMYRRYHYEDARFPLALSGISDNAVRFSRYVYDAEGRVTSTEWYSSSMTPVNQWSFTYPTLGATTVIDPKGAANNVTSVNVSGVNLQVGSSQPAGSGCAGATSNQVFDASGNAIQRDDFNGNRVCMSYDAARNIEVARVEGLPGSAVCTDLLMPGAVLPTGSRKVTTQWHPDWHIAARVAQPKRLTTSVYNGQPDPFNGNAVASCAPPTALLPDGRPVVVLCKQVQQATADESGALGLDAPLDATVPSRTWLYTYNSYGQVLVTIDPRGSATTNTYYTSTTADYSSGDLQQVQNAVGQVTLYPQYNAHGQVLRSVDANGVITEYGYDLRQRLALVRVAGQATTYEYWPNGLIKRVTQPDSSYIAYEYDDARRLIAISDSQANRFEYTLDSFGIRTEERVLDPAGSLRRQLTRVPDALGRIQRVTGRE